jgi:hypothetical protein
MESINLLQDNFLHLPCDSYLLGPYMRSIVKLIDVDCEA